MLSPTQIMTPTLEQRTMTKQQQCHDKTQNFQTAVQLTIHHNSKKKENNGEQQKHLQYERFGSCHNI